MKPGQPSTSHVFFLLVILVVAICCLGSSDAHPTAELQSSLDSFDLLTARSAVSSDILAISSGKVNSANRQSKTIQSDDPGDDDNNEAQGNEDEEEEEEHDDKSPDGEYEPSAFPEGSEKRTKVENERKKQKANGDGGDLCRSDETSCYGECCDNQSQHCAHMAIRWALEGEKYSTCCPKGKKAGKNGRCCKQEEIGEDGICSGD